MNRITFGEHCKRGFQRDCICYQCKKSNHNVDDRGKGIEVAFKESYSRISAGRPGSFEKLELI
jgi:hypothetical protein